MTLSEFINKYQSDVRLMEARDPDHYWRVPFDRVVIDACRTNPGHREVCEVYPKIALTNRVYAANLGGMTPNAKAEWNVAQAFVDKDADAVIAPIVSLTAFNLATLPAVVHCHRQLVQLVHEVTKRNEESFCSKYLSFHYPETAPVLDHHSEELACRLTAGTSELVGDGRYERHCRRVLYLADALRSNGVAGPSIKMIDHVLYGTRGQ
jgi:hypothetical protein